MLGIATEEKAMRQSMRHSRVPLVWAVGVLLAAIGASGAGHSPNRGNRTATVPAAPASASCSTDSALCLSQGRFLVEATWTKANGESGIAHAVPMTEDSGYFWILEPGNPELAVKTLNGCSINGHYWFFSGGLTNLAVTITVTDLTTNQTRTYANPQGKAFAPVTDTAAFSSCPAGAETAGDPEEPHDGPGEAGPAVGHRDGSLSCTTGDTALCLNGRFQVEATWETASGRSGPAHALNLTSESGYFWFFDPSNVELVVKTLNACGIGRGNWLFAAGMTTVDVHLTVTDMFTGAIRTYDNPAGKPLDPIQDTSAFSFCPTPTPSPTPTPTPTSTSTWTPTATRTPRPPFTTPLPNVWIVDLSLCGEFVRLPCFRPSIIHIRVGDSVRWTFESGSHSTTSGIPGQPDGRWDSGVHDAPFAFSHRFSQAGIYPYFCSKGHCISTSGCPPGNLFFEKGTVIVDR